MQWPWPSLRLAARWSRWPLSRQARTWRRVNKYVVVRANGANTGIILIGTTVANVGDGFILSAGQVSPPIYVDQLNKLYLVGGTANQAYSWIAC